MAAALLSSAYDTGPCPATVDARTDGSLPTEIGASTIRPEQAEAACRLLAGPVPAARSGGAELVMIKASGPIGESHRELLQVPAFLHGSARVECRSLCARGRATRRRRNRYRPGLPRLRRQDPRIRGGAAERARPPDKARPRRTNLSGCHPGPRLEASTPARASTVACSA